MFPIHTPRLSIRPFAVADADSAARLLDACFGPAPRAERAAWLEWTVQNYAALARLHQPPYGDYAVTLRGGASRHADADTGAGAGEVVGAVGLVPSFGPFERLPSFRARLRGAPSDFYRPEMGLFWATAPARRGNGYATEAAAALAAAAFGRLRVDRLVATTEHDNGASIAVMRKIGMTVERNPDPDPPWFQTVGVLFHPGAPPR